jgi:hypothetical protein
MSNAEESPVLAGLLIGFILGLVIGPVLRSWLTWREYLDASREARLHEETMRRMGPPLPGDGRSAEDSFGPLASR